MIVLCVYYNIQGSRFLSDHYLLHMYAASPTLKGMVIIIFTGYTLQCRVSFRSLLYLKRQLVYLLKKCKKSKTQVIYQPRWVEKHVPRVVRQCCCGPYEDPEFDLKEIVNDICPRDETDGEEMASKRGKRPSLSAVTQALKAAKK